ncbi:MAG: CDP-alcohol phosphatidyltransferase family protein [Thiohalorhabdaceae bacterium]
MTLANALTLLRLTLVPVLVVLLHQGSYTGALALFVFAGLTDAADGFVRWRQHCCPRPTRRCSWATLP